MTNFGVDYSFARPTIAELKAHGVKFVCRYVSTPGNAKNLTASEARDLIDAGIEIVTIFETSARRALAGSSAGRDDAHSARSQARAIGQPEHAPIYYAVDFPPTDTEIEDVKAYFRGIGFQDGVLHAGVYGSYATCHALHDSGLVGYTWQTYAWSNDKWLDSANIRQYRNGVKWGNDEVDYNKSITTDYGQWPFNRGTPIGPIPDDWQEQMMTKLPTLVQGSKDKAGHVHYVRRVQVLLHYLYGKDIGSTGPAKNGVDGDYGPATARAIAAIQQQHGLDGNGKCGPETWSVLYTGSRI